MVDHVEHDVAYGGPALLVIEDRALLIDHRIDLRVTETHEVGAGARSVDEAQPELGLSGPYRCTEHSVAEGPICPDAVQRGRVTQLNLNVHDALAELLPLRLYELRSQLTLLVVVSGER